MNYRVSLTGPGITLGGLGRSSSSWQGRILNVPDEKTAIEQARQKCRAEFSDEYARGRATVVPLYDWKVTLRGRTDGRKRETFFAMGADEKEAVANLRWQEPVIRFAGHNVGLSRTRRTKGMIVKTPDKRVVKVERV